MEIARNIGLPQEVIEKAEEKTGRSQLDFDRQLQDLEVERHAVTKKSTELSVADDLLSDTIEKYTRLTEEVERTKKEILAKAREEAHALLKNSNKLIEKTIKEIRESQAEKGRRNRRGKRSLKRKNRWRRRTRDEGRRTH